MASEGGTSLDNACWTEPYVLLFCLRPTTSQWHFNKVRHVALIYKSNVIIRFFTSTFSLCACIQTSVEWVFSRIFMFYWIVTSRSDWLVLYTIPHIKIAKFKWDSFSDLKGLRSVFLAWKVYISRGSSSLRFQGTLYSKFPKFLFAWYYLRPFISFNFFTFKSRKWLPGSSWRILIPIFIPWPSWPKCIVMKDHSG